MTKKTCIVSLAIPLLLATSTHAEEATPPKAEESAPAAETPTPAEVVQEKLTTLETKIGALEESNEAHSAAISKMSKLKLSGYIQPRFEWKQDAVNGVTSAGAPGEKTFFYIRRARLGTSYTATNAGFLFSFDGGQGSFAVKDVEAAFVDTFTPLNLRISVGQFKYPFGYEIPVSSSVREMPERAIVLQRLFPGERDRGVKVQGQYEVLRFALALVNGNGSGSDAIFAYKDTNSFKDFVGRVGLDLDYLTAGVSTWYGLASVYNPSSSTSTDVYGLKKYKRFRGGVDAQAYLDVPELGGLVLRGEFVYSRDKNAAYGGVAADKCQDRVGYGYLLTASQNIGQWFSLVARYDAYDPLLEGSLDGCANQEAAKTDGVSTLAGALLIHLAPELRATLAYDHPFEQGSHKKDNDKFTLQLQAKF